MTTIAADFRTGVMASDSRSADDVTWVPCTKIFRIGEELIGIAGDLREVGTWLKWVRGGRHGVRPKLTSFGAIVMRAEGLYGVTGDGHEQLIERGFHAIGTGAHAALAVLLMGGDPKQAVEIACQIDVCSGGAVRVAEFWAGGVSA